MLYIYIYVIQYVYNIYIYIYLCIIVVDIYARTLCIRERIQNEEIEGGNGSNIRNKDVCSTHIANMNAQ